MLLLAKVFLSGYPDLYVGLVLYGLAPCIAMVIVFTFLSQGNNALAIVLVAINSICQDAPDPRVRETAPGSRFL